MTLPLLILRPIEGAQKTATSAEKTGLRAVVAPLFEIRPLPWHANAADQYDAVLFSSANAVKMAGPNLQEYKALPALAVGPVTRQACEAAGFDVLETGVSGVQSLADKLPEGSFDRILRLSGKEYTSVKSDRSFDHVAIYESVCIGLSELAQTALKNGSIVLIHSMRAAQMLLSEMKKNEIALDKSHIVAISSKAAEAAGNGWKSVHFVDQPTDEALLRLAVRLCSG
jgi:uroporphyrinogen-III synthase